VGAFGRRRWAIADGYLPAWSTGPAPELESHGTVSFLNVGDEDADVALTIFFADREPVGPYRLSVPAARVLHQRFTELDDPAAIPTDTDFAALVESSVPIVVQHTRLDTRQPEAALMTTIAFAG
jgi:hypothetical protein